MSIKVTGEHIIKFVRKAQMWCETWFEYGKDNKATQKQRWAQTKEELEKE